MIMAKVFIGVGHGGKDPGAVGNGLHEADLNLAIALACRDELERHGVTVGMSRVTDENDPVGDEAKECNAFAPDLGLDIHCNAGGFADDSRIQTLEITCCDGLSGSRCSDWPLLSRCAAH